MGLYASPLWRLPDLLLDHRANLARMPHDHRKLILSGFQDREKLINAGIERRAALGRVKAPPQAVAQRKLDTRRLATKPSIYFRVGRARDGGHGDGEDSKGPPPRNRGTAANGVDLGQCAVTPTAAGVHRMIAVMLACHGAAAQDVAGKHARRCLRRNEPDWAALWYEVAKRIAAGDHGAEAAA
jgi:hypothetical protein